MVSRGMYAVVCACLLSAMVITIFVRHDLQKVLHLPSLPGKIISVLYAADRKTAAVLATQERRKTLMADICDRYVSDLNILGAPYPTMFSSNKQKFLYCAVPKVACTSWKSLLAVANGAPASLHPHSMGFFNYVDNFENLTSRARQHVLSSSYFKFMIVRHPYERLVSGYRDKLVELPGARDFKYVADEVKRLYRDDKLRDKIDPPTFKEFVQFLIDPRTYRPFNPHWRPQHELCQPCRMNFDFIGHYETLADDARYVLDRLRIPADQLPQPSISRNSSTAVADMFSQLSQDEIRRLIEIYRLDFALFGYSPNISQFIHTKMEAT